MPQCTIPWGNGELDLPLPEDWTLAQTATPAVPPAPSDWTDRLGTCLTKPEGAPPLAEVLGQLGDHGRVVLVVEDMTRHSPLVEILGVVVRELEHARIDDKRIEILFATGMHPAMTAEEVAAKIGPWAERFAWRCNDARADDAHVEVGDVAEFGRATRLPILIDRRCATADLRIVVTSVSPHLQAGFGGGAKMLAPGCAALDTISRLHWSGLPAEENAVLVGMEGSVNPMRQMIDQVGELVDAYHGRTFAVQYVLDASDSPSAMVAGDLRLGQQMLAKQCAAAAGVVVDAPADIVITNAWPRDYDLWQAFKCIPNTAPAVRANGVIIALARCPAGLNMDEMKVGLSPKWIRRIIRWIGVKRIVSLMRRFAPGVNPEAHFFIKLAAETIHRNPILMYAPEIVRRGQKFPGLPMYDDLAAAFAVADRLLGPGGRRVVVFTAGGVSYPVL